MIDGEEGLVVGEGQRLGRHHAHHHAADQAGPAGGGDAVEVGEIEPGGRQGVLDQPVDPFEMGARGDLRHHAAEAAMLGQLAIDDIGQDPAERSIARRAAGAGASTMATAVSSQLVSIPRTRMRVF